MSSAVSESAVSEEIQRLLGDAVRTASFERLNYTVQIGAMTLLFYDYTLTLIDEIQYIWMQPWRLSTILYLCCRYSLLANPIYFISISKSTALPCDVGYILSGVLSIFGHIGIISVWGLRTSAIYEKAKEVKVVSVFLGLLGSAVVILLIIRAPFNKCSGLIKFNGLRGAISALMLCYEVSAFLLAALRAWRTVRGDAKLWDNPKVSMHYVVFSQGLIYISAVFALSTTTIFLNFHVKFFLSRLMNTLKLPLSGFLTARFLLELRIWDMQKTQYDPENMLPIAFDPTATSTGIEFNRAKASPTSRRSPDAIRELGGDIGPTPRRRDGLDIHHGVESFSDVEDEDIAVELRQRSEHRPIGESETSTGGEGDSPVSARFSPTTTVARRNRPRTATDRDESGSQLPQQSPVAGSSRDPHNAHRSEVRAGKRPARSE